MTTEQIAQRIDTQIEKRRSTDSGDLEEQSSISAELKELHELLGGYGCGCDCNNCGCD